MGTGDQNLLFHVKKFITTAKTKQDRFAGKFFSGQNKKRPIKMKHVITSYSIHYTKLYEYCKKIGKGIL